MKTLHASQLLVAAALAALYAGRSESVRAAPQASPVAPCTASFQSPLFVPMATPLSGVVFDTACEHVYFTNTALNRVEDLSLATLTLSSPIQVGSLPIGLDVTPDGSLLYVANSGGNNLSVVNLAQRAEVRKIIVPPPLLDYVDTPYSIAIANNGLALLTMFGFSGVPMMQLDLATDQITKRTDFSPYVSARTRLSPSGDHSAIGVATDSVVVRYAAISDTFGPARSVSGSVSNVSLDRTGALLIAVTNNAYVFNSGLAVLGTFPGTTPGSGALDPEGTVGYRTVASRIDVLNVATFLTSAQLPLGDSAITGDRWRNFVGQIAVSPDGRLLAVITDHGFSLVRAR